MKINDIEIPQPKPRRQVELDFGNCVSVTEQDHLPDADINRIIKACEHGAELPKGTHQPVFGDFSDGSSYLSLQDKINYAKAEFLGLPADIRAMFGNSVPKMLDWISDPANNEQAIALGLLEQPAPADDNQPESPFDEHQQSDDASTSNENNNTPEEPQEAPKNDSKIVT